MKALEVLFTKSSLCLTDRLEGDRSEGSGQENENEDEE